MKVFAKNYRGFDFVEVDLKKVNFLIGDNSSGKTSILHLIHAVSRDDLNSPPCFDEDFGISEYDYFSPYFNFANVTFGYSMEEDGGRYCKIVTVRRRKDGPPRIIRCSYFIGGKLISVKLVGNNALFKVIPCEELSNNKCIEAHGLDFGYKTIPSISTSNISLGNPSFIVANLDCKELGIQNLIGKAFECLLDHARLVSPTRALPEKFYSFRRKFNAQGLHFAAMWMDFFDDESSAEFLDIEKFGQESGLFDRVIVKRVSSRIEESPLLVLIEKSGRQFLLNQVGVGVSQVVPVLIEAVFSLGIRHTVLMQQPELHLHPVAQAALGSYIFKASNSGLRGVIETHSSFLIDRFRADLRDTQGVEGKSESTLSSDEVSVLFCENTGQGNIIHNIVVNYDGSISGEPDKYHEFFVDELVRTMF